MILEGILTTLNDDGSVNIAPMGPVVDPALQTFRLKPFQTSTTFHNLLQRGAGVFHVTDDVELLARAAIGQLDSVPRLEPCPAMEGFILADACRWFALRVHNHDEAHPRAEFEMEVVAQQSLRDFFGFNRAKHAVLEAAILATRVHLIPPEEIQAQFVHLAEMVDKTGGPPERRALHVLSEFVALHAADNRPQAAL